MMNIENPWNNFEISDYMVHSSDAKEFEKHNKKVKTEEEKFLGHLAPEPWIGSTEAKVLVLFANPGATRNDMNGVKQKCAEKINDFSLANLKHEAMDYPLFFLNPDIQESDGYKWFAKRFREMAELSSPELLSQKLMTCELAPYHSVNWKSPTNHFSTQRYTFQLVEKAIAEDKVILVIRGRETWFKNVNGLEKYLTTKRAFLASSPQSGYPTKKNLSLGFDVALEAING